MKLLDVDIITFVVIMVLSACSSHYRIVGVERTRLLVDDRYDDRIPARASEFISSYKQKVDSVTGPVVGRSARYMAAFAPESPLSNLLPDILMWVADDYGEKPDFAVYNIGGMRAAFAEGDVTVGDVLDVVPFENRVCFVTLSGAKVLELFGQIAGNGGEGVSHGVRLRMTRTGKLLGATIEGVAIDITAEYRIATIDFVAQGNDGMYAFKSSTNLNVPQGRDNNVLFIITDYFREKASCGLAVDSKVEGRIVVDDF